MGVLQGLARHGIRVPEEIAIIGFDDIDFASAAVVPLSSVRQPSQLMGETALRVLLAEIDDPTSAAQQIVFEPELVVRASTRHPRPLSLRRAIRLRPLGKNGSMIRLPFLDGWTVGPKLGAFEAVTDATAPQPVTLPHDAIRDLERSADSVQGVHAGYYPGGVFEYAKTFDVPEGWRDRTIALEFEGVYRDAVVFVNGDYAAQEPNGYDGFTVVLDPFLRYGAANRITVDARSHKDSRWYTGAGIYRPVHLVDRRSRAYPARRCAGDDARHRRRARDRGRGRHRPQHHPPHPHCAHPLVRARTRRSRGRRGLRAPHGAAR